MDDEIAIERCRNGEQEAFRHLVERYQKQAVAHATAILGSREDALDRRPNDQRSKCPAASG